MLPKKFRLSVKALQNKGKTLFHSDCVVLKVSPNKFVYNRAGIIFSKNSIKKAVLRNKIKRTVYDLLRKSQAFIKTGTTSGHDLFFVVKNTNSPDNVVDKVKQNTALAIKEIEKLKLHKNV
jgi:ribonuclease P protein component